MNSITIELPTDYTVKQAYIDAAIAANKVTVEKTVNSLDKVPSGAKVISKAGYNTEGQALNDVEQVVVYSIEATDEELEAIGKQVWLAVINDRISTTRLTALKVKYNTSLQASIV